MSTQLTLFTETQSRDLSLTTVLNNAGPDKSPIARRSDPATSHQAATDFNLPLAQRRAHDAAKVLLRTQPDVTANEIAEWAAGAFGCRSESVRKRCHELVTAGLFLEGPPRKCSITGKQCTTYRLK